MPEQLDIFNCEQKPVQEIKFHCNLHEMFHFQFMHCDNCRHRDLTKQNELEFITHQKKYYNKSCSYPLILNKEL